MPRRPSRKQEPSFVQEDANETASRIVEMIALERQAGKNPFAVALGKLGGSKGGKVRAEKLSPAKRKQIARKAAKARWRRHQD